MLGLGRRASSSESSSQPRSQYGNRSHGLRLSLNPPRMHRCSQLCTSCFRSQQQALGGHQSVHNHQQDAIHRMYMQISGRKRMQEVREVTEVTVPVVNDDATEIDLELRLGCGPPAKKVLTFYEFLPIKKAHDDSHERGIRGAVPFRSGPSGVLKETYAEPETRAYGHGKSLLFREPAAEVLPVRAGTDGGGGSSSRGGFLQASKTGPNVGVLITEGVTSKTGVDVTLKL